MPLHLAAYENDSETVKMLLRFGAQQLQETIRCAACVGILGDSGDWSTDFLCKDWHGHPSPASIVMRVVTNELCWQLLMLSGC